MRKLHEKSIFLGIGIGMIITSIAGMIYSSGTQKELSRQEIISMAKGYGLVEPSDLLISKNSSDEKTAFDTKAAASTDASSNTAVNTAKSAESNKGKAADSTDEQVQDKSTLEERSISVAVQSGFGSKEVAKELLEKGVIASEKEFNSVLASYNASQKIRTGTYFFKENDDLHYIVKTICKFK
ncbi:hypothetical protein LY28_00447 [Ruminiclostridium sufflavum DSM 19573]|uniref:YceG-like family protein n=1 Tax=Ruminiclostridium sufflavum DSM 19573 TaxID=1121337 RepID=A0A318XNZ2_9FIRM|nr:ABC transporter substrate-binding protein [Ruminiclostridium sufflavum]PYG89850.1 hypothetical protein LY28_00447 [Ruminiclostridium sufflavum DSM 19573]